MRTVSSYDIDRMGYNVTFLDSTTTMIIVNGTVTETTPLNERGISESDKTSDSMAFGALKLTFGIAGIVANLFVIIVIIGFTQVKRKVGYYSNDRHSYVLQRSHRELGLLLHSMVL